MKKIKNLFNKPLSFIKNHKIISAVLIIVIIVIGFILRPKPGPVIETQVAKSGDIIQSVSVTGKVDSTSSANLSFPLSGQLSYVGASVGDKVYKWEIIAAMDTTKLQANLRQAWQDFNAAKATVEQVYDQTGRVSDLTFAQKVSQTAAEATQNKAYDNTRIFTKQIQEASIVSPIAGTLIRADATVVGASISTTTTYTVADDKSLLFSMDVDEGDVGKIQIGQNVNIIIDSFPDKTISASIASIDPISHTTTTGGNAYTVKTQPLTITSDLYRIGMNGDADIIIKQKNNVLTISSSAIFDNNKVYVKIGNKFVKKTVEVGLQNDTDSEILSGITEGDIVALQPSSVISN